MSSLLPLVSPKIYNRPKRTVRIVLYSGFARFALLLHASCLFRYRYIFRMKFTAGFTYRNLHSFARFPGDSTALVIVVVVVVVVVVVAAAAAAAAL